MIFLRFHKLSLVRVLLIIVLLGLLLGCASVEPKFSPESYSRARHLINVGVYQLREEQLDEAAASFGLSMELAPSPDALDGLAAVAFRREDYVTAQRLLTSAIELDPQYGNAYGSLAEIMLRSGDPESAKKYYQKALILDPGNSRIRNNYAVMLIQDFKVKDQELMDAKSELIKARAVSSDSVIENNLNHWSKYEVKP